MIQQNDRLIEDGKAYLRTIGEPGVNELLTEGRLRREVNPKFDICDPFLLRDSALAALREFMKCDLSMAPLPVDPLSRFEKLLILLQDLIQRTGRENLMTLDNSRGLMLCRLRLASLMKRIGGESGSFNLTAIQNDAKAAFDWIGATFYDIGEVTSENHAQLPSLEGFLIDNYPTIRVGQVKPPRDLSAARADCVLELLSGIFDEEGREKIYCDVGEVVTLSHDEGNLSMHFIDTILVEYFRSTPGFVIRMGPNNGLSFIQGSNGNCSVVTNGSQFFQAVVTNKAPPEASPIWQIMIGNLNSEQGVSLFNSNLFDF